MSEASFGNQTLRASAFETSEHEFGDFRSTLGTPERQIEKKNNETVMKITLTSLAALISNYFKTSSDLFEEG